MEPDMAARASKPSPPRSSTPTKPATSSRSGSLRASSTPTSKLKAASGPKTPVGTSTRRGKPSPANSPAAKPREAWSPQPRLYSGSILYITHDLIRRVAKTQHMSEIRTLKLFSPDAKIAIVENLNNLPNLQELDLSDNKIEKMRGFDQLKNLRILLLSKNLIYSLECSETLSKLTILDLSHNLLERIPAAIRNLVCLQALMLDHNKLATLRDITNLRALKNLTTLTVHGNPLTELEHARLFIVYHIPTLNELDVDFVNDDERAEARERFAQEEITVLERQLQETQEAKLALQVKVAEYEVALCDAESSEASLRKSVADLSGKNVSLTHELFATTELLDKKSQEVATLSEALFELKQELAMQNIDKSFDEPLIMSTPAPDVRTSSRAGSQSAKSFSVQASPFHGQGYASTPTKLQRTPAQQPRHFSSSSPVSKSDHNSSENETLFYEDDYEDDDVDARQRQHQHQQSEFSNDSLNPHSWTELSMAESEARANLAREVEVARQRIRAEEERLRTFKAMLEEREKSLLETTGNFIAKAIAEVRQDIQGVGEGVHGVGNKVEDVQEDVEVISADVEELRRIVEKQEKMLLDLQQRQQHAVPPSPMPHGSPYPPPPNPQQPMMMGYGGTPVIISYPPNYQQYPQSAPASPYAPPQTQQPQPQSGFPSGVNTPMQRSSSFIDEERTNRLHDTIERLNRTLSSGTISGTQTPQPVANSDRLQQLETMLVEKELTIRVQKDTIEQLKRTCERGDRTPRGSDEEETQKLRELISHKEQRIRELESNVEKLKAASSSSDDDSASVRQRLKAALAEQDRLESELRKATVEKFEAAQQLQSRSMAIDQHDKTIDKLRATITQLHDQLDEKSRQVSDLQRQLDVKARSAGELQDEVDEQAKLIASLRSQLSDQFRIAQELQTKLDDNNRGRASLQRQLSDSKLSVEQAVPEKARTTIADLQRRLDEEERAKAQLSEQLQGSKQALSQSTSALAAAEEKTKSQLDTLQQQLVSGNELILTLRAQIELLIGEKMKLQEDLAAAEKKLEEARVESKGASGQTAQLQQAIDDLKRTVAEKDRLLTEKSGKVAELDAMVTQLKLDLQLQKEHAERSALRAKTELQETRFALSEQQEAQGQLNAVLESLRTSVQMLKVQVEDRSNEVSMQKQLIEKLQAQAADQPPDQSAEFLKRLVSLIMEFPDGTALPLPTTVDGGTDRLRQLILALLAKLVSKTSTPTMSLSKAASRASLPSSPVRQRSVSAIPLKPASAVVPTLNTSGSSSGSHPGSRPASPPASNGTNTPVQQESPPASPRSTDSSDADHFVAINGHGTSTPTVETTTTEDGRFDNLVSRFGSATKSVSEKQRSWRAEESHIMTTLNAQAKAEADVLASTSGNGNANGNGKANRINAAQAEADVLASTSGKRSVSPAGLSSGVRRFLARSATVSGSTFKVNSSDEDAK